MSTARQVGAEHGYALAEGEGGPNRLVFKMGMKIYSWGSKLVIDFAELSPTETQITIDTHETFAVTDWGRGKKAAEEFLQALGARHA